MNWPALFKAVGVVAAIIGVFAGLAWCAAYGGESGGIIALGIFVGIGAATMVWVLYQYYINGL